MSVVTISHTALKISRFPPMRHSHSPVNRYENSPSLLNNAGVYPKFPEALGLMGRAEMRRLSEGADFDGPVIFLPLNPLLIS